VVGHHGLIHHNSVVQYGHGAAVDSGDKVRADLDLLLFLFLAQKLEKLAYNSVGFFTNRKFVMQDFVHGAIRHPMGSRKIHAGNTAICFHFRGASGDNVQSPLWFFRILVPLTVGSFASLNFFDEVVNRCTSQRFSPKASSVMIFILLAMANPRNKIVRLHYSNGWQGGKE
jgi:hypothetical protein